MAVKNARKKNVRIAALCAGVLFSILSLPLAAQQTGTIAGRVIDSGSGEPMVGVNVVVRSQQKYTITDMNGQYTLEDISPGNTTVEFQMAGYDRTQSQVNVTPGMNRLSVSLSYMTVGELVVTAKRVSNTEAALLSKRKKAPVAQDAISAEQISKSPDSDAATAAKRVTGVTIVGGDTVYIRGLGERYSAVQFAGSTIPSPDPDKRIVPLDIFPTGLIDSIEISKAYTPDRSGEFAGGIVNINPKDYPEELIAQVSIGTSLHTNTMPGDDFYTYTGGGLDFLGYDDGTRALPSKLENRKIRDLSPEEVEKVGEGLNNVYTPKKDTAYIPLSTSFSVGDSYTVGTGSRIGFIVSGLFSESSKNTEYEIYRPNQQGSAMKDFDITRSTYTAKSGGLLSVGYASQSHKIRMTSAYSHTGKNTTAVTTGYKDGEGNGNWKDYKLQFDEKTLWFNQIGGENHIIRNLSAEWKASYSRASMYQPDTRSVKFEGPEHLPRTDKTLRSRADYISRFYLNHNDSVYEAEPALVFQFKQWNGLNAKLKTGGAYTFRERESEATKLGWKPSTYIEERVENAFTDENIGSDGLYVSDVTTAGSDYNGELTVLAGYGQLDIPLWQDLRFVGGVRYENADMNVSYWNPTKLKMVDLSAEPVERHNILPAGSMTYSVTDDINLRLAYSETISRPDFREVTEFAYETFVENEFIIGNKELTQTDIQNYDFRMEWFPSSSEVLALSFFYKYLENPIELMQIPVGGDGTQYKYTNAVRADNYGAEFELRKNLGFLHVTLEDLVARTNVAYIVSEITVRDTPSTDYTSNTRPLQGQSPYVINAGIDYENEDTGSTFSMLYNIYGRRITSVGTSDSYDDDLDLFPGTDRYKIERGDVYEEPVAKLDFVYKQKLYKGASLKFTASNLLDPEIKRTQKQDYYAENSDGEYSIKTKKYTLSKHRDGRTFGLSVSYSF
ncbi:MAG: TonB-dependent receptor domain-containing protein [Spirochaetota bacterium]